MISMDISDGVAVLMIDMPDRSMNVLTPELAAELQRAVDAAIADEAVKGIIIASGKDSFIAGADLAQMPALAATSEEQALRSIAVYGDLFRSIERAGKPVVGAASGTALGGGLELLLATHYRIAADVPSARFGLPEVTLGLLPGAGGTQRLPRMIGIAASLPLLTSGRNIDVHAALKAGVLDSVVPAERLLQQARAALAAGEVDAVAAWDRPGFSMPCGDADCDAAAAVLQQFDIALATSTKGNYPAQPTILRAIREGSRLPMDEALELERRLFVDLVRGRPAQNMIRTLFLARQAADRLVRRPAGVPASKVRKLGVLGAGFMGAGIAQVSALAGIDVVLLDRSLEIAEASRAGIAKALQVEVGKGRLDAASRDTALERIVAGGGFGALSGCDLVIEAVVEDETVKARVTDACEEVLAADAIYATNTSALPIDELAIASRRRANFIGLHFFSPVPRMALVEVIVGKDTSEQTLARALDYIRQIRKTPIVVNDGYGFYTTRCVDAYYREGIRLLADGVDAGRIEHAGVALGMPVGPLTLCDEIGLDVLHHIAHFFRSRESGSWADDRHQRVNAIIDAAVRAQRFGRKKGAGFHAYPAGQPKRFDLAFLDGCIDRLAEEAQPDVAAIAERLLYAQLLEAVRCRDEGVADDPDEIDLGAHLGWAFPSYLGGPAAAIDDIGAQRFVARLQELVETVGPRFTPPAGFAQLAAAGFRFRG